MSKTRSDERLPVYEQTVAETGIDPMAVNVEILGLLVNAEAALARVYGRKRQ